MRLLYLGILGEGLGLRLLLQHNQLIATGLCKLVLLQSIANNPFSSLVPRLPLLGGETLGTRLLKQHVNMLFQARAISMLV